MEKRKSKIAIIGGNGNMGKRYRTILKFLRTEYYVIDLDTDQKMLPYTTGILICTPTDTHYEMLKKYSAYNIPILCEKPICKDLAQLEDLLDFVQCPLRMINQYDFWFKKKPETKVKTWVMGDGANNKKCYTYYNYYHSGMDGLMWDCINIIGLDRTEKITLGQNLPTWHCWINGELIPRQEMDDAYIWNIEDWLEKQDDNRDYIRLAHKKVSELNARYRDMYTN